MTNFYILVLVILTETCVAQDYAFIDDIPIESYNHGDHQENDMDLELLPERRGRSFSSEEDPKEYFFRSMRSFDDMDDVKSFGPYQNIPSPSFQTSDHHQDRKKRSAPVSAFVSTRDDKSRRGIVKNLGKPLEVVPLESRNLTEKEDKAENRMAVEDDDTDKDILINDFIRFRRATNENPKISRGHNSGQGSQNPLSEKLVMENPSEEINREARGATKEQWMKQLYPVRKSDEMSFDDNIPLSSENVRAPRVHFVTQKFTDNGLAASDLRPYEREARSRHLSMENSRELPRDFAREIGRENPYSEKRFRYYGQQSDRNTPFFRDELYSRYDPRDYRDTYHPRYDRYERIRNEYSPSAKKPKRIIYYATLPEISRTPPNVDLRDRYRYDRDRYDDRYLSDPYRFSKSYPKSRYEDEGKTPYPVKVLTDVNVREVKKNPERRIYSEVDRNRYAYNTPPYRAADG